jgi:hypothetical protein
VTTGRAGSAGRGGPKALGRRVPAPAARATSGLILVPLFVAVTLVFFR